MGGGINCIPDLTLDIQRAYDNGIRIAIVLDADRDIAARRREVEEQIREHNLPISEKYFFLLPDNCRPGNLETLLEELATPPHRAIFRCLDAYGACLQQARDEYLPPGGKGRIYAYCEALRIEPRGTHRTYDDGGQWDLGAAAVEPLASFLRGLST